LEASKAATLADILLEQHIRPKNIDTKLLNEEAKLRSQAVSLQMKLAELKDETQREKVSNDLNEILIKSESLSKQFEKDSKSYYQLKYNFSTISIPQIQAKLAPQTAFVSYFLGEKNYAFLITKTAAKVVQLADNLSLENNTKALVSELYRKPGLDVYKGSLQAQSLYNSLLKPFEKELADKTQLIVLRDGNLNFLPFEVLEKSPNDYLVKHFAISYGYSATILFNALNNKELASKNNLMAIAPYTSKQHLPSTFRDKTLQSLPASGEEVSKIGGDIYTDQQATKNRFLETYQQHGIIHFATHAQVDDREAGRSFIAFYPDSSGYKLYTEELYNLSLQKTRLVVLSACETGRGQLHQGEGILSLARAFAYAGCPSVVATLWNAHDESTAFLSERLHHYLQENLPIDLALQQAKLDYFNSKIGKELDHPYYWANFILLGNAEPVNEDVGWAWWVWVGIIFGGIVFVLVVTSRKFFLPPMDIVSRS
jgi:CHAT domain-containing protein